jgi:hypothetical protein
MNETAQLAGYAAAHAVWSISDGETLIPILAYVSSDGSWKLGRLTAETIDEGVRTGREWMARNPDGVPSAVLVYDGYLTFETGETDALFVEARGYETPGASFRMAVPYRPPRQSDDFLLYRPRLLESESRELCCEELAEEFSRGVDQHEQGAAVWDAHMADAAE